MLPGPHVQAVVLHGCGGSNGMAPRAAEPFHSLTVPGIAGDRPKRLNGVVRPHLAQFVHKYPRVLEHDTGRVTFLNELREELSHALVAPKEDRGIMIVPDFWIVHHMFQVADQWRGSKIRAARWDQRLMHVQSDSERALHATERHRVPAEKPETFSCCPDGGLDNRLGTANVGDTFDVLSKLTHGLRHPSRGGASGL